jgi:CRP/FNR family cyclic AMP-dependent transcriptional regulator
MRLGSNAKIDLLKSVPLFAGCSKKELEVLASIADEIDLKEGSVLTQEGQPGREFFVLVEGSVDVTQGGDPIARLEGGDWFGEIALMTKATRTASPPSALSSLPTARSGRSSRRRRRSRSRCSSASASGSATTPS